MKMIKCESCGIEQSASQARHSLYDEPAGWLTVELFDVETPTTDTYLERRGDAPAETLRVERVHVPDEPGHVWRQARHDLCSWPCLARFASGQAGQAVQASAGAFDAALSGDAAS